MEETILRLNYIAGTVAILMIPLWFFCIILWRIQLRIERHEEAYKAIKETVSAENYPERQKLCALTTFRNFRKEQPEFKQAVLNKLKTYDIVPTAIEKTMSPEQLYQANNPLWMSGMSVMAIRNIIILENKLGKDVVVAEYIDEYV